MGPAGGESARRGACLRGVARILKNGSRILQAKIVVKLSCVQAEKWPGRGGAFLTSPNNLILYETLLPAARTMLGALQIDVSAMT